MRYVGAAASARIEENNDGEVAEHARGLATGSGFPWHRLTGAPMPEGRYFLALFIGQWPIQQRAVADTHLTIGTIGRKKAEEISLEVTPRMAGRTVTLISGATAEAVGSAHASIRTSGDGIHEVPALLHVVEATGEDGGILIGRMTMGLLRLQPVADAIADGGGKIVGVQARGD